MDFAFRFGESIARSAVFPPHSQRREKPGRGKTGVSTQCYPIPQISKQRNLHIYGSESLLLAVVARSFGGKRIFRTSQSEPFQFLKCGI